MSVRKKNLSVRNIKVYPTDFDVSKKCFVRFYIGEGVKVRLSVAKRFNTVELRQKEAERIVNDLKTNGFDYAGRKAETTYNKHLELLFALLDSKTKISAKTRAAYLCHIRALNAFCASGKIQNITADVAQCFLDNLLNSGSSERTVNAYRRDLKGLFACLVKQGKIKKNPFDNTAALTAKPPFSEHYNGKELSLIIQEIKQNKPLLFLPLLTIYYCFIRNGRELPHVKIQDIDFVNSKMWVNGEYAKNGQRQGVLIPSQLLAAFLDAKLDSAPPQYFAFTHSGAPGPVSVSTNFFQVHFRDVLEKIGIYKKGKGIYRLKNTGNVALIKANFNRTAIQKQNRHSSFATTEKYISSLQVDDFTELKDKFPSL